MQRFSEAYGQIRQRAAVARETPPDVPEEVLQCIWYDRLFSDEDLRLDDGRPLTIASPGWWNRGAGPDFRGAQLAFSGINVTGDVEVHKSLGEWQAHGHHLDANYDAVALEVVLDQPINPVRSMASDGRPIPYFVLGPHIEADLRDLADDLALEERSYAERLGPGQCAAFTEAYGADRTMEMLRLAGEWRVLHKARLLRDRMDAAGDEQALYEGVMAACGFSRYKHHFRAVARSLPYDRARQIALRDPFLLEAALLQIAGLLPAEADPGLEAVQHYARLRNMQQTQLQTLRSLPLTWKRGGCRPINFPERRLAGAALFLARTAQRGLCEHLERLWLEDLAPRKRREALEGLFGKSLGFWAHHCTWTGKHMEKPAALLGKSRVLSIMGNVFVPGAVAQARRTRNRRLEERALELYAVLPKEADNHVVKAMIPRFFGDVKPPKLDFRTQQGLMQMYQDWCEPNPSCRNCAVIPVMDARFGGGHSA